MVLVFACRVGRVCLALATNAGPGFLSRVGDGPQHRRVRQRLGVRALGPCGLLSTDAVGHMTLHACTVSVAGTQRDHAHAHVQSLSTSACSTV